MVRFFSISGRDKVLFKYKKCCRIGVLIFLYSIQGLTITIYDKGLSAV